MKAVRFTQYGGPEVLELIDTDIPKPSADEVLVRMASLSVSKPDFLMRTGRYPWTRGILPFSPGVDGTGIIVEAGSDVKDLVPGTPVYVEHPIVCGSTQSISAYRSHALPCFRKASISCRPEQC